MEQNVNFVYLGGGLAIIIASLFSAYGEISDNTFLKIILTLTLIGSGISYMRFAFHRDQINDYIKYSLFTILASLFFLACVFFKTPQDDNVTAYMLFVVLFFLLFFFSLIGGLGLLVVGFLKGPSIAVYNEINQPLVEDNKEIKKEETVVPHNTHHVKHHTYKETKIDTQNVPETVVTPPISTPEQTPVQTPVQTIKITKEEPIAVINNQV